MVKLLKILLWLLVGVVVLVAGAAIALPYFFDPNDYRDKIESVVKEKTGRELTIGGEIELRVFPWLGVGLGETRLGNAPGFGSEPFAEISKLDVNVRLLPLLWREIEAGAVEIKGLKLHLGKAADGTTNWADLIKPAGAKEQPAAPESEGGGIAAFKVGAVKIEDAALTYTDKQAGTEYRVENLTLETGELGLNKEVDVSFKCLLTATQPELAAEVDLSGTVLADAAAKLYSADKLKLNVVARGAPIPGGKQEVNLTGTVRYDQGKDELAVTDTELSAAGLTLNAAIQGTGLTGESPSLSGELSTHSFSPRDLASKLGIKLPATTDSSVLGDARFTAKYLGTFKSARLDNLNLKLDQTTATGTFAIRDFATQAAEFALKVDSFDADRYLPSTAETTAEEPKKKGDINQTVIPVELLDKINAAGTVAIGALKLKNLKFSNVLLKVAAARGEVKTEDLSANFYGGQIVHSARITPGAKPAYDVKATLKGVNTGPLLLDFMGKDYVTGAGTFSAALTSSGITVGDARKALNGDVAFNFANGAVKGFNLAQIIRKGQASLRGEQLNESAAKQTDFAELKGSGKITNGVLQSDDLSAKSPLFRLAGAGKVDLVAEQIDYVAKPTIVESGKGQGGKELAELAGLTVPVHITGSLYAPSYKLDFTSALQQKAKAKAQEELKKQEQKLRQKFRDLLAPPQQ